MRSMVSKEGVLRHRFITMLKSALVDVAQFARASLPRDPIHIVDYAVARCLSIRLSVRLLHTGILLSKRLHVSSNFFHHRVKVKVNVWTLVIAPPTRVRLVTSSALQSRKYWHEPMVPQRIMWPSIARASGQLTHGAASRHTIAPISHTRPSPRSRRFPVPLRVGGRVGLSTQ